MPITTSYSGATRRLTAQGDAFANVIIFARDLSGTLFVNGGAVPISGGPATTANTDLIVASGLDDADVITLDQAGGLLPAASLNGGNGNDTLTGGSSNDMLSGDAGVDTLIGGAGIDVLQGGLDRDSLTGGDGNDTMSGGDGNDRMIWNPGDDSDVMEGGAGTSDLAEVNGGNGAETFAINANGARVDFRRTSPAPFAIDIGTTERLVLNAGGGDDAVNTSGNLAALISLTIDGGSGNDTINGGNGADEIFGGDGNDFADGNAGADSALLGAGADVFRWDSGDGGDTVDGEAGIDRIELNGTNAAEFVFLSPNSGRISLSPDFGAPTLDLDNLERITIAVAGGADSVNVGDLAGTDAQIITLDLAGTIGGNSSDGAIDVIGLEGTADPDNLTIAAAAASSLSVTGLSYSLVVNQADPTDGINFHGQAGDDTISAAGLATPILQLVLGGDAGADTITGSAVADQLFGGADNDVLVGGPGGDAMHGESGNDLMIWNADDGDDVMDGGAGTGDIAQVRTGDTAENLAVGNTATTVNVGSPGGGFSLDILATELLLLEAGGGNDFIQANGNLAGLILVTLDGGAGNDNIVGGNGGDTILGGDGDDFVQGRLGDDHALLGAGEDFFFWEPGDGSDFVEGQGDVDTLRFDGAAAGEVLNITSSAGRIAVQRDIGSAIVTLDAVEQLVVNALAGSDTIFVTDLAGGGASAVTLNLAQTIGGTTPDLEVDNVLVSGGNAAEIIAISGASGFASITGLPASISINQLDSHDSLNVAGGSGNDTIGAGGVFLTLQSLVLDGNAGDDTLVGSVFKDTLFGGDGNDIVQSNGGIDTVALGDGDDLFIWNSVDDDDLVTGDAGQDTLRFNSSDGGETIVVQPSIIPTGMGALVVRGSGADVVSTDLIETIVLNAFGGEDIINIFNLTGTDVTRVVVDLGSGSGGPDGRADTINLTATSAGDAISITSTAAGIVTVTGLAAVVEIRNFESIDRLVINALVGDDVIDATGVALPLTIIGGPGNDTIKGGIGADVIVTGPGDNIVFWTPGPDFLDSAGGTATVFI